MENFNTLKNILLQEKAVKAAMANKSLLAVFPTGGGKSLTFQVPALISLGEGDFMLLDDLEKILEWNADNA